jgi:hypothetical protein
MTVSLRPLEDRDLDTIYQQVTDPESIRMAAFTAEDQTDARAASDNVGSLRVLEKAGFRRVGVNRDFAPGRGEEIEETILRLD